MNHITLEQLKEQHARITQARDTLKLNLVAHDGALQQLEQLILLASRPAEQPPAPLAESGEAGQCDPPADGQPGASQKA